MGEPQTCSAWAPTRDAGAAAWATQDKEGVSFEPATQAARYVVRERASAGLGSDAIQPNLASEALFPLARVAHQGELPDLLDGRAPRGRERENARPHALVVKFQLARERDAARPRQTTAIGGHEQKSRNDSARLHVGVGDLAARRRDNARGQ